ncbi:MAG TPA: VOC family protein [Candidatus Binataceae bacterium]|nr:VOC family protein [Candidatus Binataceae bacterium]
MLKRFFHLNLNCKNFERSLAFYQMLGFKVVRDIGEGGGKVFERGFHIPNNNARAAMLALGDDPAATQLDLIEWKSPPTQGDPPPNLYHAGVARIAVETDDLQAEYAGSKRKALSFCPSRSGCAGPTARSGLRYSRTPTATSSNFTSTR